jgi:hypothetical protein
MRRIEAGRIVEEQLGARGLAQTPPLSSSVSELVLNGRVAQDSTAVRQIMPRARFRPSPMNDYCGESASVER